MSVTKTPPQKREKDGVCVCVCMSMHARVCLYLCMYMHRYACMNMCINTYLSKLYCANEYFKKLVKISQENPMKCARKTR